METFYRVSARNVCSVASEWLNQLRGQLICPECSAWTLESRSKGVDVVLDEKPSIAALVGTSRGLAAVARTDFLGLFADVLHGNLRIGRVYDALGNEIPDHACFLSPHPARVRGGPSFRHNRCETCGCFRYYPMGDPYVLRRDLPNESLYADHLNRLILNEELRNRIERGKWKGITIEKLLILDEPLDGIEHFPDNFYYWDKKR